MYDGAPQWGGGAMGELNCRLKSFRMNTANHYKMRFAHCSNKAEINFRPSRRLDLREVCEGISGNDIYVQHTKV